MGCPDIAMVMGYGVFPILENGATWLGDEWLRSEQQETGSEGNDGLCTMDMERVLV